MNRLSDTIDNVILDQLKKNYAITNIDDIQRMTLNAYTHDNNIRIKSYESHIELIDSEIIDAANRGDSSVTIKVSDEEVYRLLIKFLTDLGYYAYFSKSIGSRYVEMVVSWEVNMLKGGDISE